MAVESSVILILGDTVSDSVQGVTVELDDTHPYNLYTDDDGELQVRNSFTPGSPAVIIIHHPADIYVVTVKCTHGVMTKLGGPVTRTRTQEGVTFTSIKHTETLSYSFVNEITLTVPIGNIANIKITNSKITMVSGTFPSKCNLSFPVKFNEQWQLTPGPMNLINDEQVSIDVVVYLEKKALPIPT